MNQDGDLSMPDGRRFRRRRLAVIVTALAAVAIAVTPAGSAGPPSSGIKQYAVCLTQTASTCDTSALPGGSMVSLTLTITNANTSTQSLGSANVDGPVGSNGQPIFPINLDPAKGPVPTFSGAGTFGTNTSGQLQLRNLNLPPTSKVSVSFSVTTPCAAASGTWKVPAKQ